MNTEELLKIKKVGYIFYSYSGQNKYKIVETKKIRKKIKEVVNVDTGEIYDFDYFKKDVILEEKDL